MNASSYASLASQVREAGLFESKLAPYAVRWTLILLGLALSVICLFLFQSWWVQTINAFYLAAVFGQAIFIGHDVGHRQVLKQNSRPRRAMEILFWLLLGVSSAWWIDKHMKHHVYPNDKHRDPDMDFLLLYVSADQVPQGKRLTRLLAKRQTLLFFPLQSLKAFGMRANSLQRLIRSPRQRSPVELASIVGHIALLTFLCIYTLGVWGGLGFLLINQLVLGLYLGLVFAPNHKGMRLIDNANREDDYVARQVTTARNIHSGLLRDFFYGNLNHQIEHHLFPHMPSLNLAKAQPIVRKHCQSVGLPYEETGVVRSYKDILSTLSQVSKSL